MKITVKQLRQLIREQVEMAMHEDETVFMPQASEQVQKAVQTINAADALAKNWARRNLKLENIKRKARRLYENEEAIPSKQPSKQEVMAIAKRMSLKDAEDILAKVGLSKEKLATIPKVDSITDKIVDSIESGKIPAPRPPASASGMDEKFDPWSFPQDCGLSCQMIVYAAAGALAGFGPWMYHPEMAAEYVPAAIAVVAASIAYDKWREKKDMGA